MNCLLYLLEYLRRIGDVNLKALLNISLCFSKPIVELSLGKEVVSMEHLKELDNRFD